jgi:hypothetical protein
MQFPVPAAIESGGRTEEAKPLRAETVQAGSNQFSELRAL